MGSSRPTSPHDLAILLTLALGLTLTMALPGCGPARSAEEDSPGSGVATSSAQSPDDSVITSRDLETDTGISAIDIEEIRGRGLRRNDIPSLNRPKFVDLDSDFAPTEDVRGILFEHEGERRFYPGNIMLWHEVVNDTVGGRPVVVTY